MPIYWPSYLERIVFHQDYRKGQWSSVSQIQGLAGRVRSEAGYTSSNPSRPVIQNWLKEKLRIGEIVCLLGYGGKSYFKDWESFKLDLERRLERELVSATPGEIVWQLRNRVGPRRQSRGSTREYEFARRSTREYEFAREVAEAINRRLQGSDNVSMPCPFGQNTTRTRTGTVADSQIEEEDLNPISDWAGRGNREYAGPSLVTGDSTLNSIGLDPGRFLPHSLASYLTPADLQEVVINSVNQIIDRLRERKNAATRTFEEQFEIDSEELLEV